jgi:hypothetical protein
MIPESAMTHAGWIAAACTSLLAVFAATAMAETEQLRATADTPAILTARVRQGAVAESSPRQARLIISVTSYRPADDCTPVEIVVDGKADGAMHRIGRFGITPAADFNAPDPSQALRFSLPLPAELRTSEAVQLTVRLELHKAATPPAAACGRAKDRTVASADPSKGAFVQIGSAHIR